MIEPELLICQRAFPEAQRLLSGARNYGVGLLPVGWHDADVEPIQGAAAVVRRGSPLEPLRGEILRISVGDRSAYVWVIAGADVETDLSISRRAMLAVGYLAASSILLDVEVIG